MNPIHLSVPKAPRLHWLRRERRMRERSAVADTRVFVSRRPQTILAIGPQYSPPSSTHVFIHDAARTVASRTSDVNRCYIVHTAYTVYTYAPRRNRWGTCAGLCNLRAGAKPNSRVFLCALRRTHGRERKRERARERETLQRGARSRCIPRCSLRCVC